MRKVPISGQPSKGDAARGDLTDKEWVREQLLLVMQDILRAILAEDHLLGSLRPEDMRRLEAELRSLWPVSKVPDAAASALRRLGSREFRELLVRDIDPMVRAALATRRPS